MHRLDRGGIDVLALVEPVVEADQHVAGAGRGVGLALDLHAVAARGDVHAEAVLDHDQVAVVIAEQRAEQIGLLELQLEPGAAVRHWRDGGEVAAGHQAATLPCGATPPRLLGQRVGHGHVEHVADARRRSRRCTDCSQGDLPIIWPGRRPLRSIRISVSLPMRRAVEGEADARRGGPAAAAVARPSPRARPAPSIVAAGVPGRGADI